MKVKLLLGSLSVALLLSPLLGHAEIYKWKDTNGVTRYSDTPPPSNVKQEVLGRKKNAPKPTGKAPLSLATDGIKPLMSNKEVAKPAGKEGAKEAGKEGEKAKKTPEEAALERQKQAEADKKDKELKEAQAKLKADNCRQAKANYESFNQGGRVVKVDENGKRTFLDDAAIKESREQASRSVEEHCN